MPDIFWKGPDKQTILPIENGFSNSQRHSLSLVPVQQEMPEVITSAFDSIASLMNGSGPRPTGVNEPEVLTNEFSSGTYLSLISETILREEHFGGIVYNPKMPVLEYVNRPAFSLLQRKPYAVASGLISML